MRSTHQSTRLNFIPDETALDVWKRVQESDSIVPQEVETAGFADSFQPSYAEPIRQPASNSLSIRLSNNQIQELKFHEGIEIQAVSSEVPEIVLNIALEFASRFETGLIIHISTGNNLYRSLEKSGVDLTNVPLYRLHRKGRVKSVTVLNILQLLALLELLRQTLQGETTLILCEEMIPLFIAQKVYSFSFNSEIAVINISCLEYIWINSPDFSDSSDVQSSESDSTHAQCFVSLDKYHFTKICFLFEGSIFPSLETKDTEAFSILKEQPSITILVTYPLFRCK